LAISGQLSAIRRKSYHVLVITDSWMLIALRT
jgi:hypothetical protein